MTHNTTTPPVNSPKAVQGQATRLLDEFVKDTAGVTHALLVTREGLRQASVSHMEDDWADTVAAAFSGVASLAHGTKGPTNKTMPASQVLIERPDTLFLMTEAGTGSALNHTGEIVSTILVVLARPDANIGSVGYAAGQLVQRFSPFMTTPVRTRDGQDAGVE
ncbi:roadblock/LC7 domain-containing protein [Streptomyces pseudovenezuelae]|uniref:Regulator of Ras-like GTPase activity (Roadblock/LC7/MglB family) n=1 Tax=Streptomyces pseudovenezuelae TaxID=67350 RepID=A0ABT6M3N8_9ACTN|nr:roadblock/LC7 domain-containing protein [Streptomyces pseudovenezuelae]MDH6222730.1 putative regulator of Ras-like GTPase activity (Roadblock/LC7/MglB family) [Streptomyces pseudovenezuelae]